MINFAIPGMYELSTLNFRLLDLYQKDKSIFYPNVNIDAVFGNFQFCIWDGGRIFTQYRQTTKEEIEYITHVYNETYHVPIRFIFTNTELKPSDYNNRFCNLILDLCENDLNQIVINNNNLMDYIHENYPQYKFISSTTKCLNNTKDSKAEIDDERFFEVCLDYNLNRNLNYLKELTPQQKDKTEFLVNAICPSGCPYRKEHYKLNSLFHLTYGKQFKIPGCSIHYDTLQFNDPLRPNNLSPEEIFNVYYPLGFSHFKLEGRTLGKLEVAANYVHYLIKPEYQLEVLRTLVEGQ